MKRVVRIFNWLLNKNIIGMGKIINLLKTFVIFIKVPTFATIFKTRKTV